MDVQRVQQAFTGVIATSITPLTASDEVDYAALKRNARFLIEGGSDVIVPAGNTAEHSSLTPEEIKEIARAVMEEVAGRAVVVVGLGGSLPIALELARYVQDLGVDGVMVHQPAHVHYSHEGVARYLEAICDAAPNLAVVPYKKSSAVLPNKVLKRLAARENLLAVKYAEPDVHAVQDIVSETRETCPHVVWVNGLAETWAPAFHAAGAPGFTSGLVNVAPHLCAGMRDALRADDKAKVQALWEKVKPFEYLRAKFNSGYNVPVVKEAAAQLGHCERTVRPPLSDVLPEDARQVTAILKDWELL